MIISLGMTKDMELYDKAQHEFISQAKFPIDWAKYGVTISGTILMIYRGRLKNI